VRVGGTYALSIGDAGLGLPDAGQVFWSSDSNPAGTPDVGLKRTAAGVVRVTDGGAGRGSLDAAQLGDCRVRHWRRLQDPLRRVRRREFDSSFADWLTLPLAIVSDPGGNFSNSTHYYTVPVDGVYLIFTKLRPDDDSPLTSYAQGAGIDNVDDTWIAWGQTYATAAANRNGLVNFRIVALSAGDQVRMYAYSEADFNYVAEMNIILLAKS
jgi:hypothetical protein